MRWWRRLRWIMTRHTHHWEAEPGILVPSLTISQSIRNWGVICHECGTININPMDRDSAEKICKAMPKYEPEYPIGEGRNG